MSGLFTVSNRQLQHQINQGAAPDGDHLHWLDKDNVILTEDGPRSAAEAQWFLHTGRWPAEIYVMCDEPTCIQADHLTDLVSEIEKYKQEQQSLKDEELMQLVQRNSVSLADLYRKGKARGLLTSTPHYK